MSNTSLSLKYLKPFASSLMVALLCTTSAFAVKLGDKPLETLQGSPSGQKVLYRDGTSNVEKGSTEIYKSQNEKYENAFGSSIFKTSEYLLFKAPRFHPYNPTVTKGDPFWIQLPKMTVDTFMRTAQPLLGKDTTQELTKMLKKYDLKPSDALDLSFHAQEIDEAVKAEDPLLFRPHYLVHPQATKQNFDKGDLVDWAVFHGGLAGLDSDDVKEYGKEKEGISTHPDGNEDSIVSPPTMAINSMASRIFSSEALSVLRYLDFQGKSRIAVTYHWLLDPWSFGKVQEATRTNTTLNGILKALGTKDAQNRSFKDHDDLHKNLHASAKALANLELDDVPAPKATSTSSKAANQDDTTTSQTSSSSKAAPNVDDNIPAPHASAIPASVKFNDPSWRSQFAKVEGVSGTETWGAWSEGKKVTLQFKNPLPSNFTLRLKAGAFGPNAGQDFTATVGGSAVKFTLTGPAEERILHFTNTGGANTLIIDVPTPTTPASLNNGIGDPRPLGIGFVDMGIALDSATVIFKGQASWPGVITKAQGLSGAEPSHTWSEGKKVTLAFTAPLPSKGVIHLEAGAFGPNVGQEFIATIGGNAVRFKLAATGTKVDIPFTNPAGSNTLTIDIPQPTSPASLNKGVGDSRLLGMALSSLGIEDTSLDKAKGIKSTPVTANTTGSSSSSSTTKPGPVIDLNVVERLDFIDNIQNLRTEAIKSRIQQGFNPNQKDPFGFTPLLYAASSTPEIIRMLLDAGANPMIASRPDSLGMLPLHLAVFSGKLDNVKALAEHKGPHKIDINAKANNVTALQWARSLQQDNIIKYLEGLPGIEK